MGLLREEEDHNVECHGPCVVIFPPHESSDSRSQKWVEQVLLPLCLLTAGDNENEHCITVRRLHLDRRVDAEHAADHHAHDEGRRPTMQPAPWETAPSLGDILLCAAGILLRSRWQRGAYVCAPPRRSRAASA